MKANFFLLLTIIGTFTTLTQAACDPGVPCPDPTCGNGIFEPYYYEQCDGTPCCSSSCTIEPDGTNCLSGSGTCEDGVCMVPAEIYTLTTVKIESQRARVEWTIDEGAPYDGFQIRRRDLVNGQWTSWNIIHNNVNPDKRARWIKNLDPNSTYQVSIRSKYRSKTSAWKDGDPFTTISTKN